MKSRALTLGVVWPGFPVKVQGWSCIMDDSSVSWVLLKELTKKTPSCSLKFFLRQGRLQMQMRSGVSLEADFDREAEELQF